METNFKFCFCLLSVSCGRVLGILIKF